MCFIKNRFSAAPGQSLHENKAKQTKKKARLREDAPSNKTYGNCLLGFHCSHATLAATRINPGFFVVAGHQQGNPSTIYPQTPVDALGTNKLRSKTE
jgi:hypothetical protein